MRNIKIRLAQIEDAEAISDLIIQLGYDSHTDDCKKFIETMATQDLNKIFVASNEEKIYGFIHLHVVNNIICETHCEILALITDQSCRSQGIGRLLLDSAEKWSREHDLDTIKVNSNIIRTRAHQFYLSKGFELKKTQHYFIKKMIN
ncbi:MAG: GNAT family N-acetyltransferase [Spirochaetales bacterium]|nr:GNAT family N-acetyltransferase [Spirochaetales bacterium]